MTNERTEKAAARTAAAAEAAEAGAAAWAAAWGQFDPCLLLEQLILHAGEQK
jgi:hypothetical protein